MNDETIVRLIVTSLKWTPEQLTEMIGISGDSSWRIGDKRPKTQMVRKNNGWLLNSGLPRSEPLDIQVKTLFEKLAPHADRIRLVSQDSDVYFSCVIYANSPPALFFRKTVIEEIGKLGASLDIDLYYMDEERD